jgi:glucose/arabinose dehydrogenase
VILQGDLMHKKSFSLVSWSGRIALLAGLTLGSSAIQAEVPANQLTRPESLSGWKLLFDGKSTDGWRNYKKDGISDGWKVVDGTLVREGKSAGDIVTKKKYKNFQLMLEYKISEGGNSGLMFHVTEDNPNPWQSGPEVQIQDNAKGKDPQKSGWLYQMFQPVPPPWVQGETAGLDATRPAGQWNQIFLRIAPNQCEVSMNGALYYRFNLGDKKWKDLVSKSKFAQYAGFGAAGEGYICLQDHNDTVAFRNIKIRELADDGSLISQPIDGKLKTKGSLAFPKLKWEGWEPIDESGKVNKALRILELTYANGDNKRLFAMDQLGMIFVFENRPDVEQASRFLDIQNKVSRWFDPGANEQGLLGLAFSPKYMENGEFYVCYTKRENDATIISRFKVSKDNPNQADPASEEILLEIPQPFKNHNGGSIEFGPDGYLYISLGDGGMRNDPKASGQDRSDYLGSILRIDVNSKSDGLKYGIPKDNPFVGQSSIRPEIYAYGLRNPWRIAFDRKTGRFWCGEVGQELWEEVNVITKGGNYGWSNREGSYAFGNRHDVPGVSAPIDPVWQYDHSVGKSITGGRVYNSSRVPELTGKYVYADYVTGSIWALTYDEASGKAVRNDQVIEKGIPVMGFGEDPSGEVYYMMDSTRGECIYRFDKAD